MARKGRVAVTQQLGEVQWVCVVVYIGVNAFDGRLINQGDARLQRQRYCPMATKQRLTWRTQ